MRHRDRETETERQRDRDRETERERDKFHFAKYLSFTPLKVVNQTFGLLPLME